MSLAESSRNLLHYMRGCVDITTDTFLFNIQKSVYVNNVDYTLLENIKDQNVISGKFITKKMRFTTPIIIIVFSNKYPDTEEFFEDRLMIFKINTKMELKEVTDDSCRVTNQHVVCNM